VRRVELTNKINTYASRFVVEVQGFNATSQYHINIHAESFLIPVLNEVFGIQLENLNATQRKNYPAIDLADFKSRVAFQITATSTIDKIKTTLDTFKKHGLFEYFDVLYFYILSEKQQSYAQDKIDSLLPDGFNFDVMQNIVDMDNILQRINAISSTTKLELLAKLYEHEFSDVQIEMRKQKFEHGYLNNEPEDLFPNFLEISFPEQFYSAEVDFNEEAITERINEYLVSKGKKAVKKIRKEKLINNILRECNSSCTDWVLHEGRLLTFRDLNDENEGLNRVVNPGTIESVDSLHFASLNEDTNRVFKHLLKDTLKELCKTKGIEWFAKRGIFRFANNQIAPKQKKMKWKGKKESTKTVIFEMMNKKEGHIICFRSLAFRASFDSFDDKWYLVLNPTWSFTNPGGYKESRFEPDYMSGIKRLENNNAIYNYFRFFGYYLSYFDLFTKDFPNLKIKPATSFQFSPRLEEKVWKPAKLPENKAPKLDIELSLDNELDQNLFD
jgi:hypothetical protein